VLFVVGAPQSGTALLLDALDAHSDIRVHRQGDRRAFGRDGRLRDLAERRRLVEGARCRWVVFEPLLDLQHLDQLLDVHPGARAVFVLREPRDAARSSFEQEGDAPLRSVRRLTREYPCSHWTAERLPEARADELTGLVHPGLDGVSAAALLWWLRNEIFFDVALDVRHEEVLPVRYESLVGEPESELAELFAFLGLEPTPRAHHRISDLPVGGGRDVVLESEIDRRCRDLEQRLDAVIAARS